MLRFKNCCFFIASHSAQKGNIISSDDLRFRMQMPQLLLSDRQSAHQQRLGLLVLALRVVEVGQIVEAASRVRMQRPQLLLPDLQGAHKQRLGLLVLALLTVEEGQVVEALGSVRMLWSQ